MKVTPLEIGGAYEVVPVTYADPRGSFLEWYRADQLVAHLGHELQWVQANLSTSAAGVIRGCHVTDVPPGQAKYVTCVRGRVFDVIVDMRVGSPTYGRWSGTLLDDVDRRAVYFGEGLGHAFCALTEDATITYLCSRTFDAARERVMTPLDPQVAIAWPVAAPVLSEKDAGAPTLAQLEARGELPTYEACLAMHR